MYKKALQVAYFLRGVDPNGEYTSEEVLQDPMSFVDLMQGMLEDLGKAPDPKELGLAKMIGYCLEIFCNTLNH